MSVILNNKGAAMVEFVLILPLFVIIMLFLITSYEYISQSISLEHTVRYQLRQKVYDANADNFQLICVPGIVSVDVPERVKKLLITSALKKDITLCSYGGSKSGVGNSMDRLYAPDLVGLVN